MVLVRFGISGRKLIRRLSNAVHSNKRCALILQSIGRGGIERLYLFQYCSDDGRVGCAVISSERIVAWTFLFTCLMHSPLSGVGINA